MDYPTSLSESSAEVSRARDLAASDLKLLRAINVGTAHAGGLQPLNGISKKNFVDT